MSNLHQTAAHEMVRYIYNDLMVCTNNCTYIEARKQMVGALTHSWCKMSNTLVNHLFEAGFRVLGYIE